MNSTVNVDGQSHIYELNPKMQIFKDIHVHFALLRYLKDFLKPKKASMSTICKY